MRSSGAFPIPMATTARKMTAIFAVLCAFAGLFVFFRTARNFSFATACAPNSPTIAPIRKETVARAGLEASRPTAPVNPATDQPPSPIPLAAAVSVPPAPAEVILPPPPSGDYDVTLTVEQIDAIVEARYGGLFRSVGLPSDRLARLRALLTDRQQTTIDAANSALLTGLDPIRDLLTIRHAIEQVQTPFDATLRTELGESVFAAYRDIDSTTRERNSVGDLARLLAATNEPLRPGQEKQVMQILKSSPGPDSPVDINRAIYGGINDRARISDPAVAAAATVLSPRQLEFFRQLQRHWSAEEARR